MAKKRCLAALALIPLLAQAAEPPRPAPEYTINRNGAPPLTLSQYKGKPVVLAFILTYCSHCQRTVGFLIKDQNEYGPRGLQVLACAIENGAQLAVPAFIKNFNPPFPVGYNQLRPVLDLMQHPPMIGPRMPMIAFIDRQGILRAQYEGQEAFLEQDQMAKNIRAKIMELLGHGQNKEDRRAHK